MIFLFLSLTKLFRDLKGYYIKKKKSIKNGKVSSSFITIFQFSLMVFVDLYIFLKSIFLLFYLLNKKISTKVQKNPHLVHIPVWGSYYDTFSFFLMRNLLSDSNCCTAKQEGIKILFTCDLSTKEKIMKNKGFLLLKECYEIEFIVFSNLFFKCLNKIRFSVLYVILGYMQFIAAKIALVEKRGLFLFFSDVLIEEEFFKKNIELDKQGFELVLSNTFRSNLDKIKNHLNKFSKFKGNKLAVSAQEIVNLQCRFPHVETINRLVSEKKSFFCWTPQFIFKKNNTLVTKTYTWTPFFISDKALKSIKKYHLFRAVDDYFCSSYQSLTNPKKVFYVTQATELGICELSSPGKEGVPYKRLSGSLEDLKQYMLSVFSTISLTQQDIFSLKKGEVFKPDSPLRIPSGNSPSFAQTS